MIKNRYCMDCYGRLTYFPSMDFYYCWKCEERFEKRATLDIGDLESIAQDIRKAKKEKREHEGLN